jgi:hypothetical protein
MTEKRFMELYDADGTVLDEWCSSHADGALRWLGERAHPSVGDPIADRLVVRRPLRLLRSLAHCGRLRCLEWQLFKRPPQTDTPFAIPC